MMGNLLGDMFLFWRFRKAIPNGGGLMMRGDGFNHENGDLMDIKGILMEHK